MPVTFEEYEDSLGGIKKQKIEMKKKKSEPQKKSTSTQTTRAKHDCSTQTDFPTEIDSNEQIVQILNNLNYTVLNGFQNLEGKVEKLEQKVDSLINNNNTNEAVMQSLTEEDLEILAPFKQLTSSLPGAAAIFDDSVQTVPASGCDLSTSVPETKNSEQDPARVMFELITSSFDETMLIECSLSGKRGLKKFDEGSINIIRNSIATRFGITSAKEMTEIEVKVGTSLRNLRQKLVKSPRNNNLLSF